MIKKEPWDVIDVISFTLTEDLWLTTNQIPQVPLHLRLNKPKEKKGIYCYIISLQKYLERCDWRIMKTIFFEERAFQHQKQYSLIIIEAYRTEEQ